MIYIGIDNGLTGGITAVDSNQHIIDKWVMPIVKVSKGNNYDINEIVRIFNLYINSGKEIKVLLEKAQVFPISGKRACFMTGYGYGVMQGILTTLNISYEIVAPKTWMKEMLVGVSKDKGSIIWCKNKYPEENWCTTERSKKPHDGLTDACVIANYCYRLNR